MTTDISVAAVVPDPIGSSNRHRRGGLLRTTVLALVALVFLAPLVWMLSGSLKSDQQVFSVPPILIPRPVQWSNYRNTLSYIPFTLYLRNSVVVTVFTVIGTLMTCVPVAYALAVLRWKGQRLVFAAVLAAIMLPFPAVMIPWYIIFQRLGWIGSLLPLTVTPFIGEFVTPAFSSALAIFLLRQFFLGIPREVIEAARMDGAGHFRVLRSIVIPMSKPVLATIVIMSSMAAWTAFIGPLLFLTRSDVYTLSVGLQQYQSQHFTAYNLLLAASILFVIPVLIVFFLGQRYFVRGAALSGLK